MYTSLFFGALFTTTYLQRFALAQFSGAITPVGQEDDGILMITIENNSTGNYSIEARNNLFDDANPYQPLQVKHMWGSAVKLVGSQATYGQVSDSAFVSFPPGTVWQRVLNMTEYIPPDAAALQPYSECFSVAFPSGIFAVNTTAFVADEDLATGFLKGNTADIFIEALPIHVNITVAAGTALAAAEATATVAEQPAATVILGTATVGLGGSVPSYGTSIDDYLPPSANSIFAKEQAKKPGQ